MISATLTEWLFFHLWKRHPLENEFPADSQNTSQTKEKGLSKSSRLYANIQQNNDSLPCLIPDTIFHRHKIPVKWYFTSREKSNPSSGQAANKTGVKNSNTDSGSKSKNQKDKNASKANNLNSDSNFKFNRIKKKMASNITPANISKMFLSSKSPICGVLYDEPHPSTEEAQKENKLGQGCQKESNKLAITYFTKKELSKVMESKKNSYNYMLQKFVPPFKNQNNLIEVYWSPQFVKIANISNPYKLSGDNKPSRPNKNPSDNSGTVLSRTKPSLSGSPSQGCSPSPVPVPSFPYPYPSPCLTPSALPSSLLTNLLSQICQALVAHIQHITTGTVQISQLKLLFQIDSQYRVWLLLCTGGKVKGREGTVGLGSSNSKTSESPRGNKARAFHIHKSGSKMSPRSGRSSEQPSLVNCVEIVPGGLKKIDIWKHFKEENAKKKKTLEADSEKKVQSYFGDLPDLVNDEITFDNEEEKSEFKEIRENICIERIESGETLEHSLSPRAYKTVPTYTYRLNPEQTICSVCFKAQECQNCLHRLKILYLMSYFNYGIPD